MEEAGEIAERAMEAVFDAIEPGVRQCDAMTNVYKWVIGGTEKFGGAFTCKPPNVGTGKWAAAPHLTWTEEPHRVGEMTNMELGGCRHRYHTPLCRSIFLGEPPERMQKTAAIVVEALTAALDAVKAGITCEEMEAAWRKVTTKYGLEKESRLGYPVGIGYPPTWGELTASIRPGDKTVMAPNMTFHCPAGIWAEDWGVVISETFRVTETGAQTFSKFPRRLFWKA
jgi:Xaa-Pro aminopeptidase